MSRTMRVAWFSPLPPARTGIAAYSASVLPRLDAAGLDIDRYEQTNAHDFVWRQRRAPYDVVVYQLGNSSWHDFMWAYLFHYPGLVVLHDARLHHARGTQLFGARRLDDYRREFGYNHPLANAAAAEYAMEGLRGAGLYLWPMVRSVVDTARIVAVHNEFVAQDLREAHPAVHVERIHLGMPALTPSAGARDRIRRQHNIPPGVVVFVAFGLVTAEKRIDAILRAFSAIGSGPSAPHLVLVGANAFPPLETLTADLQLSADRVHVTGYVADDLVADYLAAADVSLSLRWPTAQETSASWVQSLAASKPTIITSLPHTADIPSLDARTWRPTRPSIEPVAVSIDLLDEDAALLAAMSRLADDVQLRERLGRAGFDYWRTEHTVDRMADDYGRVIAEAAGLPSPRPSGLPAHLTSDYSSLAASIATEIGVAL
jgi:glycosyltransferase involved in cell wall biosynthesis